MTEWLRAAGKAVDGFVWGPAMLVAMIGIGLYFTLGTRGLQLRRFGYMLRHTVGSLFGGAKKGRDRRHVSPFGAMTTALAGTRGVGNIAGVATAMTLGGPGAIFWMWVSALGGMMTKYAEVLLAVHYREKTPDGYRGGPMYYMKKGLHSRLLPVLFCLLCACASFGIGNMTQSNTIAQSLQQCFGLHPAITGVAVMAVVAMVVLGGISRIAAFTEKLVPLMSLFYMGAAIWVLAVCWRQLPAALGSIFKDAFSAAALGGGVAGFFTSRAVRFGIARGVFTNEAGLGSAPIAHASADTASPVQQGLWGMFEVFADTFVSCTLTALVILCTGALDTGLDGAALTTAAFGRVLGSWAPPFIAISILFFAVSSMLGWCFYGESALRYLSGGRSWAVWSYRILFLVLVMVGATVQLQRVWQLADTLNGLMAVPNLIALAALSGTVFRLTKDFFRR